MAFAYLCGSIAGVITSKVYAGEPSARVQYVKDVYESLPLVLSYLIHSGELKEESSAFLKALEPHFKSPLEFVRDDSAFVITEKEPSRLMRSPEGAESPVFVNEVLLNSSAFALDLPQLIKLLIHELGHKTDLADVERRDQWAQEAEKLLRPFYLKTQSSVDASEVVEALSFPKDWVEIPLEHNPFKLQPTFWVYQHRRGEVVSRTQEMMDQVNNHSLLARGGIGTEIGTVIMEALNGFKAMILDQVPRMEAGLEENALLEIKKLEDNISKLEGLKVITKLLGIETVKDADGNSLTMDEAIERNRLGIRLLNEAAGEAREAFTKSLGSLEEPLKATTVLEIKRLSVTNGEIIVSGSLEFGRSHTRKGSIKVNGIPFIEDPGFPLELRLSPSSVEMALTPAPAYFEIAKVKRVIREGATLKALEIEVKNEGALFNADLGLQIPGSVLLTPALRIERVNQMTSVLHFQIPPELKLASRADRVILDHGKIVFLDRTVEIISDGERSPHAPGAGKHLSPDQVISESFGLWGFRGATQVKETKFSHLNPAVYFYMNSPENKQFMINPLQVWLEFEVRDEVEIAQISLLWSSDQMIFGLSGEEKYPVIPITEDDGDRKVVRRYTGGGALKDRAVFRESLTMNLNSMMVGPGSRPGFKTIRVGTVNRIKHMRELDADEAYSLPSVHPIQVQLLTKDFEIYTHIFSSIETPGIMGAHTDQICESMLKGYGGNSK